MASVRETLPPAGRSARSARAVEACTRGMPGRGGVDGADPALDRLPASDLAWVWGGCACFPGFESPRLAGQGPGGCGGTEGALPGRSLGLGFLKSSAATPFDSETVLSSAYT